MGLSHQAPKLVNHRVDLVAALLLARAVARLVLQALENAPSLNKRRKDILPISTQRRRRGETKRVKVTHAARLLHARWRIWRLDRLIAHGWCSLRDVYGSGPSCANRPRKRSDEVRLAPGVRPRRKSRNWDSGFFADMETRAPRFAPLNACCTPPLAY